MIMATTFHVNAPKEEAVSIAAKFHEWYVSWILSIIFYYIYRVNGKMVSVTRFQLIYTIEVHRIAIEIEKSENGKDKSKRSLHN